MKFILPVLSRGWMDNTTMESSQDDKRSYQPEDLACFVAIGYCVMGFKGFAPDLETAKAWQKGEVEIDFLEKSPLTGFSAPYHTHAIAELVPLEPMHTIGQLAPLEPMHLIGQLRRLDSD